MRRTPRPGALGRWHSTRPELPRNRTARRVGVRLLAERRAAAEAQRALERLARAWGARLVRGRA